MQSVSFHVDGKPRSAQHRPAAAAAAARLAAVALAIVLTGCGALGGSLFGGPPKLDLGDIHARAAADANRNSPVRFDVVLVSEAALAERLMKPDQKWFAAAADLSASYPQTLHAYRCELTPGQELLLPPALFKGRRALAVFVFAELGGVERRARIEGWREGGTIAFASESWTMAPLDKAPAIAQGAPPMRCDS